MIDDAYITFRYARNLLAGHGLVYNPGEWVLGTTTPLYALIQAGLGWLLGGMEAPFPEIAWLFNACCDGLACLLLFLLGRRMDQPVAGYAAAMIWAIAPMSVTFAIGGMETSLFVLLMLAVLYFHSMKRTSLTAVSMALSILTRPDALLFVLPVILERIRWLIPSLHGEEEAPELSWREGLLFSIPLVVWGVWSVYQYGSPIPQSVAAKVAAYNLPREAALVRLLQHFATPFLGHLTFGTFWIGAGLLLFPALFLIAARHVLSRDLSLWPVFIFPVGYFLAFAIANPLIFRWYLTPPLPIYFLGIFMGIGLLAQSLNFQPSLPLLTAGALVLTLQGWTLHPDHGPDRPAPEMAYIQLELLYEEAANVLLPELEPGDVLAAGDIGALGYGTDAVILDTLGLISPQAVNYYPLPDDAYVINVAMPAELLLDELPEYLVALEVYGRETFLTLPSFSDQYELIHTIPTNIYGSDGMLIFRRLPGR